MRVLFEDKREEKIEKLNEGDLVRIKFRGTGSTCTYVTVRHTAVNSGIKTLVSLDGQGTKGAIRDRGTTLEEFLEKGIKHNEFEEVKVFPKNKFDLRVEGR